MDQLVLRLQKVTERLDAVNGSPSKQGNDLASLVERVEAVSESLTKKLGGSSSSFSSTSTSSLSGSASMMIQSFVELIEGPLQDYVNLSQKIDPKVHQQALSVQKGFLRQKEFLEMASKSPEPDANSLQISVKPIADAISESQNFKDQYRSEKAIANHLTAVAEGIPALGWVVVSPKPAPHISQMKDSAEFYTNRILKEFKDKDENQKEWAKSFPALLQKLFEFCKQYHTTGVVWGTKGSSPPPSSSEKPISKPISNPTPSSTPSITSNTSISKPTPVTSTTKITPTPTKQPETQKPTLTTENPKTKDLLGKIELIQKNDSSAIELNLNNNEACKPEHSEMIGKALLNNTHLKKLFLCNAQVASSSAIAIAEGLKSNKTLEILHLETNNIGTEGILALADALKVNTSVTEFKMTNQASLPGVEAEKALASAFDTNQTIVKFTYHGRDAGARTVIDRAVSRNAELARQKRRPATTSQPTTQTSTSNQSTSNSSQASQAPSKPAPMGQMAKFINRLEENDPSLVELNLNGNAVCSAKHGVAIAKALIKNTHLKQLMLDSTCQDTEAAIELANVLKTNKTLELLSLEKNDIGPDGIKALGEVLAENSTLIELRIRDQKKPAGVEVEKVFTTSFEKNETLLRLSYLFKDPGVRNYVTRGITRNTEKARQQRSQDSTVAPSKSKGTSNLGALNDIIEKLTKKDSNLTEFDLTGNLVCNSDYGVTIATLLQNNPHVKKVLMASCQLDTKAGQAFGQMLKTNQAIEILDLETNDIGPEGIQAIAEGLSTNKTLKELKLTDQKTPTGNEAEKSLSEAFQTNMTLLKLSLTVKDPGARNYINRGITRNTEQARKERTQVPSFGAKKSGPNMTALMDSIEGIQKNRSDLTLVNLSDNVVCKPEHGVEIAEGLKSNKTLKTLLLENTTQNNDSAIALGDALSVNETLEVLNLEGNDIGADGLKALANGLAVNKGLKELKLGSQKKPFGNEAERCLAEALDKNTTLVKLSLVIKDPSARNTVDRVLTRNTEIARMKRK